MEAAPPKRAPRTNSTEPEPILFPVALQQIRDLKSELAQAYEAAREMRTNFIMVVAGLVLIACVAIKNSIDASATQKETMNAIVEALLSASEEDDEAISAEFANIVRLVKQQE